MTINVGDVVKVSQGFRVDGVNCVITAHYELEDAGTAVGDVQLLNSLIIDNWVATLINGLWVPANSDGVLATCLKAGKVLPVVEQPLVYVQNAVGAILTDWLPAHAAVMITRTARASGPGSSGRLFFPAPPEAHFTSGRLNAAGVGAWTPIGSFFNDILSLGAFSTVWAPQHVQAGGLHNDVFRTWVNPNVRTVRSRQAIDCAV